MYYDKEAGLTNNSAWNGQVTYFLFDVLNKLVELDYFNFHLQCCERTWNVKRNDTKRENYLAQNVTLKTGFTGRVRASFTPCGNYHRFKVKLWFSLPHLIFYSEASYLNSYLGMYSRLAGNEKYLANKFKFFSFRSPSPQCPADREPISRERVWHVNVFPLSNWT